MSISEELRLSLSKSFSNSAFVMLKKSSVAKIDPEFLL